MEFTFLKRMLGNEKKDEHYLAVKVSLGREQSLQRILSKINNKNYSSLVYCQVLHYSLCL